jgi:hypothetical protein
MIKNIKKHLFIGLFLEVIVFFISFIEANGDITLFFQACARHSGRVSLAFFTLLFVYHTIEPNVEEGKILNIKYILARNFTIIHIIHWFLLVVAVKLSGFELVPFRVAGGAIAYIMVLFLPYILKRRIFKKISLGKIFNIYLSYVWLIFFMTYVARLTSEDSLFTGTKSSYILLFIFTSGIMLWRIFILLKNRNKK